jgi:hypothetical protein
MVLLNLLLSFSVSHAGEYLAPASNPGLLIKKYFASKEAQRHSPSEAEKENIRIFQALHKYLTSAIFKTYDADKSLKWINDPMYQILEEFKKNIERNNSYIRSAGQQVFKKNLMTIGFRFSQKSDTSYTLVLGYPTTRPHESGFISGLHNYCAVDITVQNIAKIILESQESLRFLKKHISQLEQPKSLLFKIKEAFRRSA